LGTYIDGIVRDTESEPAIKAKLSRFKEIKPESRELLSIQSNAITQTDWLDSKPIKHALSSGTLISLNEAASHNGISCFASEPLGNSFNLPEVDYYFGAHTVDALNDQSPRRTRVVYVG